MPIPTDTFWNIKRLNQVFAASAIVLVAVTGWTIIQDYGAGWRTPQKNSRVWEAALVDDKIERSISDQQRTQQLAENQKQLDAAEKDLASRRDEISKLSQKIVQLDSERATTEFAVNTLKSNVQVDQANLQDAITQKNQPEIDRLTKRLAEPSQAPELTRLTEALEAKKKDLQDAKNQLKQLNKNLDDATKARNRLVSDQDTLNKRLAQLQPTSFIAKLSAQIRATPLMGFVNPSERVQQVVLPDVLTDMNFQMKIPTLDRCMTCHVNIAKKDFTIEKVLAYLEEQTATAKNLKLPEKWSGVATDPTATNAQPGAVAMTEFWHAWSQQLNGEAFKKSVAKLRTVTNTVGKTAKITYDGKPLSTFAYDLKLLDAKSSPHPATTPSTQPVIDAAAQDAILLSLMDAWLNYDGTALSDSADNGRVHIDIAAGMTGAQRKPIRNPIMRYGEELRAGLQQTLSADASRLLRDRYRYALVNFVNAERKKLGKAALDPSPVLLAHPRLDLFVDVDSKHSFESVGCTSCHDGSGQETDFVLTAHTARDIWVDEKTGEPVLSDQLAQSAEEKQPFNLSSMLNALCPEGTIVPAAISSLSIHTSPEQQDQLKHLDKAGETEKTAAIAYVDPVTGLKGKAVTQFEHWKQTYEPTAARGFELVYDEWDWPMRKPEFMQVNCARCHSDIYDIKDEAPTLYEGRYLFANMGCSNCHQMDSITTDQNRQVGTDLRHVTAKLSPAYINTWIWAPKAFRPTTKMPHFFMLENNSSSEELRRTRQEARAITEYLTRTATPLPIAHPIPEGLKGSAAAGASVFNSIGCMGCHVNLNDPTPAKRSDGKLITRGESWIVTDLVKNGKLKAELTAKAGKEPDTAALTAEAHKLYDGMTYNERQVYVLENLEQLAGGNEVPKYADGSAKPIFTHHGPELSGIGTKLTAGRTPEEARAWLFDWLKEPRHYSDYTVMPRLRLSDQQAMDLTEYLLSMKRTNDMPNDPWKAELTPLDSEKLIELTALQLKSKYTLKTAFLRADDDSELTPLAVDAMTTPAVTVEDAKKAVASMSKEEKRLVFLGKKMIGNYGCMSCHAINGMETISSPCANLSDWGQKQVSKLDFGYLSEHAESHLPATAQFPIVNGLSADAVQLAHEPADKLKPENITVAWPIVHHLRQDWITQKLGNTRVFDRGQVLKEPDPASDSADAKVGRPYDKLKMPTFYLSDEQIHSLVTFVLSNRDRLVSEKFWKRTTNDKAETIARGRELVQRYNCINCHQVEQNKPQVQQYFKSDDITVLAPPSLRGEGNKIQYSWLFNFFKNVAQMRPRLFEGIRMPSFPATDEQWTAIIAYFNQVSDKESADLHKNLDPVLKYIDEAKAAVPTTQPLDPAKPWPGDDWIVQPEFTQAVAHLRQWALSNNQLNEVQLDPKQSPADLGKAYRLALSRAAFVAELYQAPYPFVDTPNPEISDARSKLGEQFFYDLQCLKCHVLGDPNVEGANKTPTAPNLSLAHVRLQRRWVRHWVQEPDIIQKGTAMPPFFTGLPIYATVTPDDKAPLGQSQPRAQNVGSPKAEEIEAKYGKTVQEQTDLLLDFLYAAGVRGTTGMQPSAAPAATPAAATTRPAG